MKVVTATASPSRKMMMMMMVCCKRFTCHILHYLMDDRGETRKRLIFSRAQSFNEVELVAQQFIVVWDATNGSCLRAWSSLVLIAG